MGLGLGLGLGLVAWEAAIENKVGPTEDRLVWRRSIIRLHQRQMMPQAAPNLRPPRPINQPLGAALAGHTIHALVST